eukprot:m.342382 g.342382  ORF g.342382 m.342382 type:complete len:451 (-) comp21319_c0_seq1:1524-2876(-)
METRFKMNKLVLLVIAPLMVATAEEEISGSGSDELEIPFSTPESTFSTFTDNFSFVMNATKTLSTIASTKTKNQNDLNASGFATTVNLGITVLPSHIPNGGPSDTGSSRSSSSIGAMVGGSSAAVLLVVIIILILIIIVRKRNKKHSNQARKSVDMEKMSRRSSHVVLKKPSSSSLNEKGSEKSLSQGVLEFVTGRSSISTRADEPLEEVMFSTTRFSPEPFRTEKLKSKDSDVGEVNSNFLDNNVQGRGSMPEFAEPDGVQQWSIKGSTTMVVPKQPDIKPETKFETSKQYETMRSPQATTRQSTTDEAAEYLGKPNITTMVKDSNQQPSAMFQTKVRKPVVRITDGSISECSRQSNDSVAGVQPDVLDLDDVMQTMAKKPDHKKPMATLQATVRKRVNRITDGSISEYSRPSLSESESENLDSELNETKNANLDEQQASEVIAESNWM